MKGCEGSLDLCAPLKFLNCMAKQLFCNGTSKKVWRLPELGNLRSWCVKAVVLSQDEEYCS